MKADGAVRETERQQTNKERRQLPHMIEES